MIKLSDRLQVIADEIKQGETVADIGTDHGLLPIFLYESKRSPRVILCDINRGPLFKAKENIRLYLGEEAFVSEKDEKSAGLELRLGSGLRPLKAKETDALVIAGMGGILIKDILKEDIKKSRSFSRLILQPRNKSDVLRRWLFYQGFEISKEHLVVERKYICEVITVALGSKKTERKEPRENSLDWEISPLLFQRNDPLLIPFLKNKIRIEENILRFVAQRSGQGKNHRRVLQAKNRLLELYERLAFAQALEENSKKDEQGVKKQ